MTDLYLIRHGEAFTNRYDLVDGVRGDTGLTLLGKQQAERLRDRLAASGEIAAQVLVGSTLLRARQTSEIIAPALGLSIEWDDAVQELRPGDADGMSEDDARTLFGAVDSICDPTRPLYPGGESWAQFARRVADALTRITTTYADQTIVIVCHAGVIDAAFGHFFGINPDQPRPVNFRTHHTAITHWDQYVRLGLYARWRLDSYNDATHLRDLDTVAAIPWSGIAPHPFTVRDAPPIIQTEE